MTSGLSAMKFLYFVLLCLGQINEGLGLPHTPGKHFQTLPTNVNNGSQGNGRQWTPSVPSSNAGKSDLSPGRGGSAGAAVSLKLKHF